MRNYVRIARNATILLLVVQALTSFGASVMGTVVTIVGAQLSGKDALAGLPNALIMVGSAAASILLGMTMDRLGRRFTLGAGVGFGVLGSLVAAVSIVNGSFIWFLIGLSLTGFTRSASMMGRFVAAEVSAPDKKGRAISYVILGGTFGSVLGPYLVTPSGQAATAAGLNEFIGPFALGVIFFLLASLAIFFFLHPEPRDIGKEIDQLYSNPQAIAPATRNVVDILRTPTAITAIVAMVFGQVIMVSLMGITTLYMLKLGHGLAEISIVFSVHTFGMFALSMLTGQLLDRWGRGPVIVIGAIMLLAACVIAPLSISVLSISIALFLLGLGWNFCFVGGSTLLSDILSPDERAKTQGANELMISLMTALSSFLSAIIYSEGGYDMAGMIGASAAIIPLMVTLLWVFRSRLPQTA